MNPRSDAFVAAHEYCKRKGIDRAYAAARTTYQGQDVIAVPMYNSKGEVVGIQWINGKGDKRNLGNVGVLMLGNDLDKSLPVYITEGWADAVSTWRIYGNVLVIAVFGNRSRQERIGKYFESRGREVVLVLDGPKK